MTEFEVKKLYGGALEAEMPSRLNNLGDMLPIPDTQEVFSDPMNSCQYIVELLERGVSNDFEAIRIIFNDIIEANQATENEILVEEFLRENVYFVQGKMKVDSSWVSINLLVIRLEQHSTDLSFYIANPQSDNSEEIREILEYFGRTFKVIDSSLFI